MKQESLYHFFPNRFHGANDPVSILKSMIDNGIYLSFEPRSVPWKDFYAKGQQRKLDLNQNRFCLTAISNVDELKYHSSTFGKVGLEFSTEFIVRLGGFPVFYVPTPSLSSVEKEDYVGISLLYRIGEAQELLEKLIKIGATSPEIDIENTLGAIRFLGNICYPTRGADSGDSGGMNFYHEREWRIIHSENHKNGLVEEHNGNIAIKTYKDQPIHRFINRIVICNGDHENSIKSKTLSIDIKQLLENYNLDIPVAIID
jgi:hypothetical protein